MFKSLASLEWRVCIEETKNVHIMKGFERQEEDFRYSIIGNCDQFMIL